MESKYTEQQLNDIGDRLAATLKLRPAPAGTDGRKRYDTTWGSKTGLGLIRTLETTLEQIKAGEAPHDLTP